MPACAKSACTKSACTRPTRIELALPPSQAEALLRLPGVVAQPSHPVDIAWHDTADLTLSAAGLALSVSGQRWSLSALHIANPLFPAGPLREEDRRELMGAEIPAATAPFATFSGTRRHLDWDGTALTLLQGRLHGATAGPELCRLTLEGDSLHALASTLAASVHAEIPLASLAAEAHALAGRPAPPCALGAATLQPGQNVGDALAHVLQHLGTVILHWAARIPAMDGPEPVHQMRVATRRLRSALAIFRHAVPSPALTALATPAKHFATHLGGARDWDVFLDGTGATMAHAFETDPRSRAMLRAARRARTAAYAVLHGELASPGFRTFTLTLAAAPLRPWDDTPALRAPTGPFAARSLDRSLRHVRRAGRDIGSLPIPALHELRKDCKRLRYAAEMFAPLFPEHPVRRFTRRLAALQEELGLLNDGAAVAGLLAQLGRYERGYAAGLATGLATAATGPARTRIEAHWRRFRATDPFWAR